MDLCAVALMRGEAIAWIGIIHFHHHTVTRRLCQNGRRRNTRLCQIALDDRPRRAGQPLWHIIAVNNNRVRYAPHRLNSPPHRQMIGLAYVEVVNFFRRRPAQPPGKRRILDKRCKRQTLLFAEFFGIRQTGDRAGWIKDHRASRNRSCPGPSSGFIYAADQFCSIHTRRHHDSNPRPNMTQTRAIRIEKTGGLDVLTEEQITLDAPARGQVLVRNTAIGLNFIDTYHRSGLYPVPLPFTLGSEGVGVVEAIGEGVEHISIGQRVGYFGAGAYADHTLVASAALVPLPDDVDDDTAAAVILKGLTCWMLLFKVYRARPADTALVWAAAGGVGSLLVPWATSLGVNVIAITGTESKMERIRSNGANHVLLANDDIPARVREITGGQGADVSYDSVGKSSAEASLSSLRERGLFVSYGNASGPADPVAPGRLAQGGSLYMTRPTLFNYFNSPERCKEGTAALMGALKSGAIKADIGQRFALSDVAEAHRALESRATVGATVLKP